MMHLLKKIPGERWEPIRGADGYAVSSLGRVSHGLHEIKARSITNGGYEKVYLTRRRYEYVHRLVAEAFLPNPFGLPEVNHKNGDKADNRVENLEWISHSDNMRHAWENGMIARRQGRPRPVVFVTEHGSTVFPSISAGAAAVGRCKSSVGCAVVTGRMCAGGYWRDAE